MNLYIHSTNDMKGPLYTGCAKTKDPVPVLKVFSVGRGAGQVNRKLQNNLTGRGKLKLPIPLRMNGQVEVSQATAEQQLGGQSIPNFQILGDWAPSVCLAVCGGEKGGGGGGQITRPGREVGAQQETPRQESADRWQFEWYLQTYRATGKDLKIRKWHDQIGGSESSLPSSVPEVLSREQEAICHEISWMGLPVFPGGRRARIKAGQQGGRWRKTRVIQGTNLIGPSHHISSILI